MGLTPKFNRNDVKRMIQKQAEDRIYRVVLRELQFIGLGFVRNARASGNYTDRTGNLRSSIGFMVMHDGRVLSQNWEIAGKGTGGDTGESTGRRIARDVAGQHPSGWVLIVVAGMKYAAAVEARGYDVLTSSSTIAEDDLKRFRASIKRMAS